MSNTGIPLQSAINPAPPDPTLGFSGLGDLGPPVADSAGPGVGGVSDPALGQPAYQPGTQPVPAPDMSATLAKNATMGPDLSSSSPLGPVLQKHWYSLTKPAGPGQSVPGYANASNDPNTGAASIANPSLTKLGKLFTVLRAAGVGAAVGSQGQSFGQGMMLANQYSDQQQQFHQQQQAENLALQEKAMNLKLMPLQQAWYLKNKQDQEDFIKARTNTQQTQGVLNTSKSGRQDQLTQTAEQSLNSQFAAAVAKAASEGRDWQQDPDAIKAQAAIKALKNPPPPVVKAMGNRSKQYDPQNPNADENGWVDVGAAPIHGTQQPDPLATPPHPAILASMQQRASGLPQPLQQELAKLPDAVQVALFKLSDGDEPESAWSSRGVYGSSAKAGGLDQAHATGLASEIADGEGRNWNASLFQTKRQTNLKFATGGTMGNQVLAFNTFLKHAASASDAVNMMRDNFKATGSPLLNTPLNMLRNKFAGDPAVQAYVTALEPVRKEYESFLNAGHVESKEDQATMKKVLDDNASPAQLQEALKVMGHTSIQRLDGLNETYKFGTGGYDHPNLVDPQARVAANHLGMGDQIARYKTGGLPQGFGGARQTTGGPLLTQGGPTGGQATQGAQGGQGGQYPPGFSPLR
jgi:hypothetical protein